MERADPRRRLELAHELAWSRSAKVEKLERGVKYIERYKNELAAAGLPEGNSELLAWTSYARIMLSANEFVYLD